MLLLYTLIQAAVTFNDQLVPIGELAEFPQGFSYYNASLYNTGSTVGDQGPAPDMVAAIDYAMFHGLMEADIQFESLPTVCSTGSCTWKHHSALDVCSVCAGL